MQFWHICERSGDGQISKEEYLKLNTALSKHLLPEYEVHAAQATAEVQYIQFKQNLINDLQEEWQKDSHSKPHLTYEQFYAFVFEVIDLWAKGLNAEEYPSLLSLLLLFDE